MSRKFKKIGLPMIVIIIVFLIFLNCFFYNQGIYIFPGDSVEQMYQFYLGGWERIRSGTLSMVTRSRRKCHVLCILFFN